MTHLQGPDIDIEISLKEYGLAWIEYETETKFYFGVEYGYEFFSFDYGFLNNDIDLHIEYDWINFQEIYDFTGLEYKQWEQLPLVFKIQDLINYHGAQNIFGETYLCISYEDIMKNN